LAFACDAAAAYPSGRRLAIVYRARRSRDCRPSSFRPRSRRPLQNECGSDRSNPRTTRRPPHSPQIEARVTQRPPVPDDGSDEKPRDRASTPQPRSTTPPSWGRRFTGDERGLSMSEAPEPEPGPPSRNRLASPCRPPVFEPPQAARGTCLISVWRYYSPQRRASMKNPQNVVSDSGISHNPLSFHRFPGNGKPRLAAPTPARLATDLLTT
jgi:hypothetical protein